MDKYLNTKQGSLEESVLEIWKEAAIEEDFRMDGRTKAYKEHRARLEAARLRKEGIKKSIQNEDDDPHADSAKSGGKEEYKKFFNDAMKKFGVSSPAELKGDKEKEFYNYIDKNWKGDQEEGLEDSPNAANSQHLCAKNVVHEEWGNGECIPTMHDEPDEEGNIGWYDVMFEHGLEKGVAINELKVTHSEMHHNHKKKKNDEEVDEGIAGDVGAGIGRLAGRAAAGTAKLAGRAALALAKKGARAARERITTGGKADRAERQLSKAQKQSKKKMSDKDRLATAQARLAKLNKGKSKTESYEMGTDEYRKHTQSITPGQDVTDFQNFKVESMREALAKVWGKAGDELEEYITKDGMRRRVAEGDKRRTENKDTGKGGKTMTGKTSDVINLKPTTEEVELDEVAPLIGMAAKALAKGALMGVGSKIADKAMGGKKEEKMLAADYMIKSGKSAEEVADVANVDVEEIKKVMAAYHEDDEKHYKEYLAAACSGGTGLGTTSMSTRLPT